MDKDAVRNQKVFVPLASVTELQLMYVRACEAVKTSSSDDNRTANVRYRDGIRAAITALQLPIAVDFRI